MSGYGFYGREPSYVGRDPYAGERVYSGPAMLPRPYDPSPPSRSQPVPQQLIYPQTEQIYRACNQPPAPPPPPQPSTREVKVIYYVPGQPGDPTFQLPAPPVPAPVARVPAPPRSSYVEMPAASGGGGGGGNQFREGDVFRVVAVQENNYRSAQPPYRYPGGYVEDDAGPIPGQRRGGPVGYQPVFYQ